MNLEFIEQRSVEHLSQTENPVVPIATLLLRLRQHPECSGLTEAELVGFLRKHPLFRVLDPPADTHSAGWQEKLAEVGVETGPRVILQSRIPTNAEMGVLIERNLGQMTEALEKALEEAIREGRVETQRRIQEMLDRSNELRRRFRDL